ncbi:MAG TPA: VWA domain-containing protein [Herpetosiphonaceae bacterium]
MTFQWPYLLLSLALIPILIGVYILAQRRRRAYAVRFTNLALLSEVVGRGPGVRRHIPPMLYLLGLAALLVSIARPMAVVAVPRDQTTVMLVMDVSGSMAADDLKPDRMTAAKEAAQAFVAALPASVQVGVVSFSTGARLNAPPTEDREQVKRAIDRLSYGGGTAIGDGLYLALDQLAQRPADDADKPAPGLVVLLSDGQPTLGIPVEEATERARQEQVKVYTVGIGQRGETPVVLGGIPVRLDEATLQKIAAATDGEYFYAAESGELKKIYQQLGSQMSWVEEYTEVTALVSGLGTLFVVAGGLLSLRWFQQFP